jgi:hypothetical protein
MAVEVPRAEGEPSTIFPGEEAPLVPPKAGTGALEEDDEENAAAGMQWQSLSDGVATGTSCCGNPAFPMTTERHG